MNIKKINKDLNISSELGELFSNYYFLKYFNSFLYLYIEKTDKNNIKEIEFISENFSEILFGDSKISELNIDDFGMKILNLFKNKQIFFEFFTYLGNIKALNNEKIQKEYKKFLRIGDYLYSNFLKLSDYSEIDSREIISNIFNKKVLDILLLEDKEIFFKLQRLDIPLYCNGFFITDIFKDDSFMKIKNYSDNNSVEDIYYRIEYYDLHNLRNYRYINKNGEILKIFNTDIIEKIYYSFNFGNKTIIKYKDINNNIKLKIFPFISIVGDNILTDAKEQSIKIDGRELKYLLLSLSDGDSKTSQIYNEKFKKLGLINLLEFINEGNNIIFEETNKTYEEFNLNEINDIRFINGLIFMNLTVTYYDETFKIILTGNGKILEENGEFISDIYKIKDILGYKFLEFGFETGQINGFLDKDFNILKIPDTYYIFKNYKVQNVSRRSLIKLLENPENKKYNRHFLNDEILKVGKDEIKEGNIFSFKKINYHLDGKDYFILNNDNSIVINSLILEKYLSNYNSFIEIMDSFHIKIEENGLKLNNGEIIDILLIEVDNFKNYEIYDFQRKHKLNIKGTENKILNKIIGFIENKIKNIR